MQSIYDSVITSIKPEGDLQYYPANTFPTIHPVHWLTSHFAVGGYSPLQRLSGMLTAHMTQIAPRNGFSWHPHRGLEIFTYVIEGTLYHEDTTGGNGTITAGEVQRMFAGQFIRHQELNRSDDPARVIQIWFAADPQYMGIEPHYEQIPLAHMQPQFLGDGAVREIIGPYGATDAHVSARLTSTLLPADGETTLVPPLPGESLFLYVVDGNGRIQTPAQTQTLNLYDVLLATPNAHPHKISAGAKQLNFLSFYLPAFLPVL